MSHVPATISLKVDVSGAIAAFNRMAAAANAARRALDAYPDVIDPPSPERRELRIIARAERAEALLDWERFKASGCRP